MEPKKEKILSKILTSEPLKKMITQLLLSLSIFSFVFSYYSLCSSSQSQLRKLPCLSASPFTYLHSPQAVNKNYIFLICNALLVFLSKTSGLLRSNSSGFDLNDMLQKRVGDGTVLLQTYNNFETKEPFLKRPKDDEEGDRISMESDEEYYLRGICGDHNFEADADKIHEKDTESCLHAVDGLIEEEDNSMDQQEEELSNEELNKKFEEFIRKTKEAMIMMNEARQLVIVK